MAESGGLKHSMQNLELKDFSPAPTGQVEAAATADLIDLAPATAAETARQEQAAGTTWQAPVTENGFATAKQAKKSFFSSYLFKWIVRRTLSSIVGLFAISVLVFIATQALPSDPARVILGPEASEEAIQTLHHQLGLDQSLLSQYLHWITPALQGDFGVSIDSKMPVVSLVAGKVNNTLILLGFTLALLIPAAFVIGIYLALHKDALLDRVSISLLIFVKAVPSFAIAYGLVMLLSTLVFNIFPAVSLIQSTQPIWGQLEFMVLPMLTLVLTSLPYLVRLIRGSLIEVLQSDFIISAHLRGLSKTQVIWKYAIPNAVIPTIQAIALIASVLLGGALVVEVVFAYPGIGSALNAAVDIRDIPVIQAVVVFLASGVMAINLLADIVTVLLTPKLRTA
jgi:peptide/nickel transport system permease protein